MGRGSAFSGVRGLAFALAAAVVGVSARAQTAGVLLAQTCERVVAAGAIAQPVPTNVAAVDAGQGRASVTWTDNSGGTAQFEVQRAPAFESMVILGPGSVGVLDDPGNGVFQYRARAFTSTTTSGWSAWAAVTITSGTAGTNSGAPPGEGWTSYTPSADTRIVYVSSSEGNDANNGRAPGAPVRTIAAGYAKLRQGMPDWLLLKRGDTWDEALGHWRKSGRSLLEPMVIATYGTNPARPLLRTGVGPMFQRSGGGGSPIRIDNVSIMGLHALSTPRTPDSSGAGIFWLDAGSNFLVEDCMFEGYSFNISIQGGDAARVSNVRIRRNVLVDSYLTSYHSSGLFIAACDGVLIEDNVFDHNGWKEGVASPTIFNHNIYIYRGTTGVALRGNILSRASSHGASMRADASITDNLFVNNSIAMFVGDVTADIRRNVILDGKDINDANPRGWGITIDSIRAGVISDNIIAHQQGSFPASIEVAEDGTGNFNIRFAGNIIYDWRGPWTFYGDATKLNNMVLSNNIIQEPTAGSTLLVEHSQATVPGQFAADSNQFLREGASTWFRVANNWCGLPVYRTLVGDTTSQARRVQFVDPERSVATYNASIGGLPTFDDFIAQARRQSRWNWRSEYTAQAVNAYIRAGFASR